MPMTSGHGNRPALDRPRAFTAQRRAALPGVESVAGSDATMRVRMIESTEEHTLARDGAAVADIHGAACVEPGERDGAGPDDHPFLCRGNRRALVRGVASPGTTSTPATSALAASREPR